MQESFRKHWFEIRKAELDEHLIHQLVDQILNSLSDDDPAWVSHVKQALTNKGISPKDIETILVELKDKLMDRAQRWGEKSKAK
jgi:SOS response regulatory protein OraA/RecX